MPRRRFLSSPSAGVGVEVLDAKIAELERARRSWAKPARECAAGDEGP